MPLGPSQEYLASFNGFVLPGYVQSETFDSVINIAQHYATYADGSLSENTGLQNKNLVVRWKVWEPDYATCKAEVEKAATILRSKRSGFAPLHIQRSDRYYQAMTQTVRAEKAVGTTTRTLEYEGVFECLPWSIAIAEQSISGTGTITTDAVGRDITHGGWTPTRITVTGTNVTVSGYTDTEPFTGYFKAAGAVAGLVVDSDAFTATQAGVNKNAIMSPADYRIFVAPGKTSFAITGASSCTIKYNNRWYL